VVSFRPALAADLRLKTFNGDVYTDFDVAPLPAVPATGVTRKSNGRFTYKSDRGFAVRVGGGGPELTFDAFNGDIRILRQGT
jgi:hypothetical protein